MAYVGKRKRINKLNNFPCKVGPFNNITFKDLLLAVRADASKTTLILVVEIESLNMISLEISYGILSLTIIKILSYIFFM